MRADAAKELVTLSYINYECELRYECLEVVSGGTRNQHTLTSCGDCAGDALESVSSSNGRRHWCSSSIIEQSLVVVVIVTRIGMEIERTNGLMMRYEM